MYAACGAVSKADHEKLAADLDTASEENKETKDELKKETKSRKDAEKKVSDTEAQLSELQEEKDKIDAEKKNLQKDAEKKTDELKKAQKQVEKLKEDLDKEKSTAEESKAELAAAKERAEKAEAELEKKVQEALDLAAEAERVKEEAEAKVEEVVKEEEGIIEAQKAKEAMQTAPTWQTGLCKCCAKPGGAGLCFKAFCCPCLVLGTMNAQLKLDGKAPCPGGKAGGCCLGCCCEPCYMCKAGPAVASKNGKTEGKCKACLCGLCCPCCYMTQVEREILLQAEAGLEAPAQETMGEGGAAKPEKAVGQKFSTGLCKCCAQPGGFKLCCKATCCPCLVTKSLNAFLKEKEDPAVCCAKCGGCGGCCMGCCFLPCFLRKAGPAVATMAGADPTEGKCKACMKGCCCPCCYLLQVNRESLLLKES